MNFASTLCKLRFCSAVRYFALTLALLVSARAQNTNLQAPSSLPTGDLDKYPGLLPEFGNLFQKIEQGVQLPQEHSQSHLLPLLPQSTIFYFAAPNFGDASNQAWHIFQNELQQSPALRAWWEQGPLAPNRAEIEDSWKKFYEFSQYLGDEVVVSASSEGGKDSEFLILAEVRKPGLKEFLQQALKEHAAKSATQSTANVRIVEARELPGLKSKPGTPELLILVRPDYVVGANNATALRHINAQLDTKSGAFALTPFGQRLAQTYRDGICAVGGIDLQRIVSQLPKSTAQNEAVFQHSGFSDVKYLIWEHRNAANVSASETELSFNGPRRGVAAWLAAPARLGSLDFVSPKAILATAFHLNNPAQIFDDIKGLSGPDSKAFSGIEQMENAMQINLKDDLLSQLQGEVAIELDSASQADAQWKMMLRVRDAERVQATLNKLLERMPLHIEQFEEDGVTYHALRVPSPNRAPEFDYAFVDGYLILASSRQKIAEGVQLHRSGGSLMKSQKFLAALPPAHGSDVSALFYEDPIAVMALNMRRASPEMAEAFAHSAGKRGAMVISVYGEENAIREVSRSSGMDAGAILIAGAIAIPNLLRARMAANDSSAAAIIRTINTAEIAYSAAYPDVGFADDLARLGPDPEKVNSVTPEHANLIDSTLGCDGAWCEKSGYKFRIWAKCSYGHCTDYAVTSTPVSGSTGSRSFCSTSDAVVHYKVGAVLKSPVSAAECRGWMAVENH